jgi:hypothetical protein
LTPTLEQEFGERSLGEQISSDELAALSADNQAIQGVQADLEEKQARLADLQQRQAQPGARIDEIQSINAEIGRLEQEIPQVQARLGEAVAQTSKDFQFDPNTGQVRRVETTGGRDIDPTFQGLEQADQLSGQLGEQIGAQQPSLAQILGGQISGIQDIAGGQAGQLQEILGRTGGLAEQFGGLAGERQQELEQAQQQAGQLFGQTSDLAQQFTQDTGAQQDIFGAEQFDPRFQEAVERSLGQAETLDQEAQLQSQQLIQATEDQIEDDRQRAIEEARDTLASRGISGGGQERAVIANINQKFSQRRSQEVGRIRIQAQQQSFQNRLQAQQNVGGLAQTGSSLRGGRVGQQAGAQGADIGRRQAQLGFAQAGAGAGQQGLQLQQALGQQQFGNLAQLLQAQQGLGGFEAGLGGSLADILRQQLGATGQLQTQLTGLPADITRQQLQNVLGQEERLSGLAGADFQRQLALRNQLLNASGQATSAGTAAGQIGANVGANQLAQAGQQSRGAAAAIGQGITSLADFFQNRPAAPATQPNTGLNQNFLSDENLDAFTNPQIGPVKPSGEF